MDVLVSGGPERPARPRRPALPVGLRALLALTLAVPTAGVLAVEPVREASAPPVITAATSGGSVIRGRLRVWLLLEGPARAPLAAVRPLLPGSDVEVQAPQWFSRRGYAVVRLDVAPRCPQALPGLASPALDVEVAGEPVVRVPFDASGLLTAEVTARCTGDDPALPVQGPPARAGESGAGDVLRAVVDLGVPGPEVLVVQGVAPGPGLDVTVVTPLPLRVAPGRRAALVVDLRADGCAAPLDAPPFALEYAADGEVAPRPDDDLRGRLAVLRATACGG